MKHPVLVRVFAVVLAILGLIMAISGGVAEYGELTKEQRDRTETADRYEKRIENYSQLNERLKNSISYDEAYELVSKLIEEHDSEASQHRTDLAEHSAKRGGYNMAVRMIEDSKPMLDEAKDTLALGKAELAKREKEFLDGKAAYEQSKPIIEGTAAQAALLRQGAEQACNQASAELDTTIASLQTLAASEPPMPEKAPETEPTPPAEVVAPGEPPVAPAEDCSEEEQAEYERLLSEYNEAADAYAQYQAELAQYESDRALYEQKLAHDQWLSEVYAPELPGIAAALASAGTVLQAQGEQLQGFTAGLAALMPEGGTMPGGSLPGMGSMPSGGAGGDSSPAALLMQAMGLKMALAALPQGYTAIAGALTAQLASAGEMLAQGEAALEQAKAQLKYGEEQLKLGEGELQKQLANIWYNMGELDKEEEEFRENKEKLDEENRTLQKQLMDAEELKELERKHSSARILLTNVPQVKKAFEEGGELSECAKAYLSDYRAETGRLYNIKLLMAALALLGGVAAVLGIPAAYEKTKKRVWLIAPIVVCLIAAAAAECLKLYLGLGQHYAALFTAIFAFIQLITALPKDKRI